MTIGRSCEVKDKKCTFENEPHVVANMIKLFFREMEDPLCQADLYDKFRSIARTKDNKKQKLIELINTMEPANRDTLMAIVKFMNQFIDGSIVETSKMGKHNLALMFAPNIFRMRKGMDDAASMAIVGLMQ
jgi:hypothetical protein